MSQTREGGLQKNWEICTGGQKKKTYKGFIEMNSRVKMEVNETEREREGERRRERKAEQ